MYTKPELVEFGSLRDLTLIGIGQDSDEPRWPGLLNPSANNDLDANRS